MSCRAIDKLLLAAVRAGCQVLTRGPPPGCEARDGPCGPCTHRENWKGGRCITQDGIPCLLGRLATKDFFGQYARCTAWSNFRRHYRHFHLHLLQRTERAAATSSRDFVHINIILRLPRWIRMARSRPTGCAETRGMSGARVALGTCLLLYMRALPAAAEAQ
ncbi:hypothetical protein MPH_03579 [Macrophomina phaseolina MS6]|uniref:Uncharacterized protein n=1 Tax=Macrophomina phaseolina (strain MS6) TaxID=1126212 RepID=K2S9U5_MACPH|nr:hypothetical protein MPH_03579 [Macrophomina phaseolina MS6]